MYGYCGKVLRVNLSKGTIGEEPLNEEWARKYIGGRGLALRYLWDMVSAETAPLSPESPLIIAAGPFAGTPVLTGSRFVVMAKSPLTGLLGDAESGGFFGHELKCAGYDLIIVEGKATSPVYLSISEAGVKIKDATGLWGQSTYDSQKALREQEGGARVIGIGQAGENLVAYASVIHDMIYACGRAGMGAVMGSKNLKAVAVKGWQTVPVAEPDALKAEMKTLSNEIRENTSCQILGKYGTWNGLSGLINNGILPTKNCQTGVFAQADNITSDGMLNAVFADRRTCYACPIRCRRVVQGKKGEYPISREYAGPQYESVAALGPLLLNGDQEAICYLNQLCDAYGMDTISVGVCIAFTMESYERGVLSAETVGLEPRWGDVPAIAKLIEMIARRQGWGDVLAHGVRYTSQHLGHGSAAWSLEVKGLEMAMHDPRGKKSVGLSYATCHRGADHMESIHDEGFQRDDAMPDLGFTQAMDRRQLEGKPRLAVKGQDYWGGIADSIAVCKFPTVPGRPFNPRRLLKVFNYVTGWNWSFEEFLLAGERVFNLGRLFIVREGARRKDDTLPPRLAEPMPEGPTAGESISPEVLSQLLDEYYDIRGWDRDGVPTLATIHRLGLEDMEAVVEEANVG